MTHRPPNVAPFRVGGRADCILEGRTHRPPRPALTLLETLVIIALLGVLLALLLPAVQRVRDAAARTRCANNLRQIGLALHQHHDAHHALPAGMSYDDGRAPLLYIGWHTRILPYIEQDALWRQALKAYATARDPFWHNPPHPLGAIVPVYGCPADGRTLSPQRAAGFGEPISFTAYLGAEGTNQFLHDGLLFIDSKVRFAEVKDGLSHTLLVGERPPNAGLTLGYWYAAWGLDKNGTADMVLGVRAYNYGGSESRCPDGPYAYGPGRFTDPCAAFHFWSPHLGGAHFLFADGSVRFVGYSAAPLMPALATRAGGEAAVDF